MKRRELIKLGSAILGSASIGAVAGYGVGSALNNKETEPKVSDKKFSIEPKQTAPYEFSSPMPFNKKLIDKIAKINEGLKKGKVTTLYSSLPNPLGGKIHPILSTMRGDNNSIKTVDDYLDYIKYAQDKGFSCTYVLNTTRHVFQDDLTVPKVLIPFFEKLYKAGIKDVKLANVNLLYLFYMHLPDINMHLSTTTEYHSVQTYYNIIRAYPTITSINLATEDNHNLEFLASLRKLFPKIKLEILVNEATCIKNCPARFYHECSYTVAFPCQLFLNGDKCLHLTKNNLVHPWQLEHYSALGINNFKLTCQPYLRNNILDVKYLKHYLRCVEEGIENYSANDFVGKIHYGTPFEEAIKFKNNYSLADLIKRLPDINKLVENAPRCSTDCGVNCRYCYDCAEKLKKLVQEG